MAVMVPRTRPGACANAAALTMASAPKTTAMRNELIGHVSSEVVGRIGKGPRHGQHARSVSIPADEWALTAEHNFVIVCTESWPLRCEPARESAVHTPAVNDPSRP